MKARIPTWLLWTVLAAGTTALCVSGPERPESVDVVLVVALAVSAVLLAVDGIVSTEPRVHPAAVAMVILTALAVGARSVHNVEAGATARAILARLPAPLPFTATAHGQPLGGTLTPAAALCLLRGETEAILRFPPAPGEVLRGGGEPTPLDSLVIAPGALEALERVPRQGERCRRTPELNIATDPDGTAEDTEATDLLRDRVYTTGALKIATGPLAGTWDVAVSVRDGLCTAETGVDVVTTLRGRAPMRGHGTLDFPALRAWQSEHPPLTEEDRQDLKCSTLSSLGEMLGDMVGVDLP